MIKPTKSQQDISTVNFLVSVESYCGLDIILFLLLPFVLMFKYMLMKELITSLFYCLLFI